MSLKTPNYNLNDFPNVYEPSEDTFLFLDAIEKEIDFIKQQSPKFAVEIGSGSGVVITALATILQNNCTYFATDINIEACLATKQTANLNKINIDCLNMDLLSCFHYNRFDIILFNPPYVVTDSREIVGNSLSRAWAGGRDGREIIDKLLNCLYRLLSDRGVCYMVLLRQNNIDDIIPLMRQLKFHSDCILERKIPGEHLFVYKFTKL